MEGNVRDTLQNGIDTLARAGHDKALLRIALIDIHAALEKYVRDRLSTEIETLTNQQESNYVSWQELINLWQTTYGLSSRDRETLFRLTKLRNSVAHSNNHAITRPQVEQYAKFVQSFTGVYVTATKSVTSQPPVTQTMPQPITPARTVKNRWSCRRIMLMATVVPLVLLCLTMYGLLNLESFLPDDMNLFEETDGFSASSFEGTGDEMNLDETETAVPTPASRLDNPIGTGEWLRVKDISNVRAEPGMEFAVIGTVDADEEYEILEATPNQNWFKIQLASGQEGWIGSTRVERLSP